jgi:hypothetical protein
MPPAIINRFLIDFSATASDPTTDGQQVRPTWESLCKHLAIEGHDYRTRHLRAGRSLDADPEGDYPTEEPCQPDSNSGLAWAYARARTVMSQGLAPRRGAR